MTHIIGTGVATSLANELSLQGNIIWNSSLYIINMVIGQPPKSLILQAGYSSMTTLIFEYNILPFVPILSPVKKFPILESKVSLIKGVVLKTFIYRMVAIKIESSV